MIIVFCWVGSQASEAPGRKFKYLHMRLTALQELNNKRGDSLLFVESRSKLLFAGERC
jgi:hypothetical protein